MRSIWGLLAVVCAACGGAGPEAGQLAVSWQIQLDGQPSTCEAVGAETFHIELDLFCEDHFGQQAACGDGTLTTHEMVAGTWATVAELLDVNDVPLAEEDQNVEIDGDADLELVFHVTSGTVDEDCDTVGDEDGDGDADCADSDCAGEPQCQSACTGSGLVIAAIYNNGGAGGAAFKQDFVVLRNRSDAAIDLTGHSLQARVSALATWSKADLPAASIPAGGYYLIALGFAGSQGADLPTPDHSDTLFLNDGRDLIVALMSTTVLNTACPTQDVADLIGIGDAPPCFEGTALVPGNTEPSPAEEYARGDGGCVDSDVNATDITIETASTPPTSGTTPTLCTCL